MTKSSILEHEKALSEGAYYPIADLALLSVEGSDRERFLQGMISNDVKALAPRKSMLASMLSVKGKLISDLMVLNAGETYSLVVPLAREAIVQETLEKYVISEDVTIRIVSNTPMIVALMGPGAQENAHSYFTLAYDLPLCPTLYALIPRSDWIEFEKALAKNMVCLSDEAFEALRIEAGIPKFGVDIDEETLVMEVPFLEKGISYTKGCYIGQETVARVHSRGGNVAKRLMGLALTGFKDAPPNGALVLYNDKEVGRVTSACYSPKLGSSLAMAMIHREAFAPGNNVNVLLGDQKISAFVVALPL
jgi:folate-binding protein YgfZ